MRNLADIETRPSGFRFLRHSINFATETFLESKMLNRRTLRIKIMQTLFALEQCKEANYLLALDSIEDKFKPDLNSMEVQDKPALAKMKKEAIQLFEKKFKGNSAEAEGEIGIAVEDALQFYTKQSKKDFDFLRKNMVIEVEKLNETYHSILLLLPAFAEVAKGEKKGVNILAGNRVINSISANTELRRESLKENSGWDHRMDKVRSWYKEVIKSDETLARLGPATGDTEAEKSVLKHIVRKLILGPTVISDHFEEEDIRWSEDKDVLRSLVDKTIKSFDEETGKISLQKLTLDWEDDKMFMEKIFNTAAYTEESYKELIARNTRNWEVDRLPLTDRVILEMAIAELISFPGIPIKVSINEYIELAKHYSTPKSRQFVNGILDVIAKELKSTGKIKKSGRGLIDNK